MLYFPWRRFSSASSCSFSRISKSDSRASKTAAPTSRYVNVQMIRDRVRTFCRFMAKRNRRPRGSCPLGFPGKAQLVWEKPCGQRLEVEAQKSAPRWQWPRWTPESEQQWNPPALCWSRWQNPRSCSWFTERHKRLLDRLDQEPCSRKTLRKTCPNQVLSVRSAINKLLPRLHVSLYSPQEVKYAALNKFFPPQQKEKKKQKKKERRRILLLHAHFACDVILNVL